MGIVVTASKLVLSSTAILGFLSTLKYSADNGFFEIINRLTATKKPTLPGSEIVMRTEWTGVQPIDEVLCSMIAFFWIVISGSSPTLSFQSVHFYGQGIATWLLMLVESFRVGNSWKFISFITVFGLLLENVAMAVVLPTWCLLHLVSSPSVSQSISPAIRQTSLLVHPTELKVLPWSVALGVGIPTFMMLYTQPGADGPFYMSSQFWILARQIHPVLTAIFHLLLSILAPVDTSFSSTTDRNRNVSKALRKVYSVAKYITIVTHCSMMTLAICANILPNLFNEQYRGYFNPVTTWKPAQFWTDDAPVATTIASGALLFLQWDELVTCASIFIWAFALNRDALASHAQGSGLPSTMLRTIFMTAIGGPAAAAVSLIEARDETILESSESGGTVAKKND